MIKVRAAQIKEIDTILAWRMEVLNEVFGQLDSETARRLLAANRNYYQKHLPSGTHMAAFVEEDGEIIGCGGLCYQRELPSPDNPNGKCAYIMNIYIRPQHRRQGYGRLLIQWLADKALLLGIHKIYLESTQKAVPMYESIGFEPMQNYLIYQGDYENHKEDAQ